MVDYDPTNLGRAATSLGLEFDFLSKGGLEGFSVQEKSQLVNGIVDENLKRGRWPAVLAMIYGGFSNVDMLYDGDRSELRDRILESAQRFPESLAEKTITILKDKGEQELLFRLATEAPFDYETLGFLANSIGNYLSDPEQGAQRTKILSLVLGRAAFEHKNLEDALRYFKEAENTEEIGKIFETVISGEEISNRYFNRGDIGERTALADPTQKESRLKRLVLAALPSKGNINPWKAFQIFKKYDVPLSLRQRNILYDRAATKSISIHDVKEADDSELSLRWAKKNIDSNPQGAYLILNKKEPDGKDVLRAASSGIKCNEDFQRKEYYGLSLDKISEAHLKKLLFKAPFNIRVKIARHLKDEKELKNLSRKALEDGNGLKAYNLWIEGKGDPKNRDISKIRTELITRKISSENYFLLNFRKDPVGAVEYYDALMKKKDFKEAHEVALDLGDEERAQRTREKILGGDLEKALSFFKCFRDEVKGEKEIEHVAERAAETYNIPTEIVREIITKYHR